MPQQRQPDAVHGLTNERVAEGDASSAAIHGVTALSACSTDFGLAASTARGGQTDAAENGRGDPYLGGRVGDIEIESLLAVGGMGRVYQGRQMHPPRPVAVKFMRHTQTETLTKRFRHEVDVLGRLVHPNIAEIFTAGDAWCGGEQLPYFVMEFVPNARTLLNYCVHAGLDVRERLHLFLAACEGVAAGHRIGIVHRDLKPGNILVADGGRRSAPRVKVIDFGLAKVLAEAVDNPQTSCTETGEVLGTRQYMSPEQFGGRPQDIGAGCDVYSLGVVLQELLTGQLPHDLKSCTLLEAARIVQEKPPRPLRIPVGACDGRLRRALHVIVRRCLEKHPAKRYADAGELSEDLRRSLEGFPLAHGRWSRDHSRWALAVAVITVGVVGFTVVGAGLVNGKPFVKNVVEQESLISNAASLSPSPSRLPRVSIRDELLKSPYVVDVLSEVTRARTVAVSPDGRLAAVGRANDSMSIVDVSDPSQLRVVGSVELVGPGGVVDAVWSEDGRVVYAISHERTGGLSVIDVSDPAVPGLLAFLPTPDYAHAMQLGADGNTLFIADGNSGLLAVDVAKGYAPTIVSTCRVAGYLQGVTLSRDGKQAFLACHTGGVDVVDVADSAAMQVVGQVLIPGDSWSTAFSPREGLVYAAGRNGTLSVVDVSAPKAPRLLPPLECNVAKPRRLVVSADGLRLYVAERFRGISTFDISTPTEPMLWETHSLQGAEVFDFRLLPGGTHGLVATDTGGVVSLVLGPAANTAHADREGDR